MTATNIFFALAMVSLLGVVGSFFWGMVAMTKGKEEDHKTSNKMMRFRVTFQAATLLFLFLAFLAK